MVKTIIPVSIKQETYTALISASTKDSVPINLAYSLECKTEPPKAGCKCRVSARVILVEHTLFCYFSVHMKTLYQHNVSIFEFMCGK